MPVRPRAAALALALALPLVSSGCILGRARDGVPLDGERVARIVPGQTTRREVVELLGAPTYVNDRIGLRVLARPEGQGTPGRAGPLVDELVRSPLDHSYTYEYTDTKTASLYLLVVSFTNQETRRDRVVVFFDDQGVVAHVGVSLDAASASFRLPVSDDEPDVEE